MMDEQQTAPTPPPGNTSPTPQLKNQTKWWHILIGVVIGMALLAGGFIVYNAYFAKSSETPSVTTKTATQSAKESPTPTPSATKDETADWKTYSSSELGFLIKYPRNWFFTDEEKFLSEICKPPGVPSNVTMFDRTNLKCKGVGHWRFWPAEFVVVVSIDKKYFDPLEIGNNNMEGEYITLDNEKATKEYITDKSQGPTCKCTFITANHNGNQYSIEWTNTDFEGKYDPVYNKILSTFKFLD